MARLASVMDTLSGLLGELAANAGGADAHPTVDGPGRAAPVTRNSRTPLSGRRRLAQVAAAGRNAI